MSEETQNQPIDLSNVNYSLPNRRIRRDQSRRSGILKIKNMFDYSTEAGRNFRAQQAEAGRKLQQQNRDRRDQQLNEQLLSKIETLKVSWRDQGYNDAEIKMLEEAHSLIDVKIQETYREDIKTARTLLKNAQQSRKERLQK